MPRQRDVVVTEFVVEVCASGIKWNGLDVFLAWLLRKRPEGGFLPYGRAINRIRRSRRPALAK
ncbi:MAG: hypothetical protein PHF00_07235 [Elusimicrobia bacterium]|nr:hypothetical protein [Elusimicrobiota bacterium]